MNKLINFSRRFANFSFFLELFLFGLTLFLSLGVAINSVIKQRLVSVSVTQADNLSAFYFLLMLSIATVILLLILKYAKNPWVIKILFYAAILEGLWYFCQIYFDWPSYLLIMIFILGFWAIYRNVLVHNFVIVLAISAIAAMFGLNFQPGSMIIILLLMASYDFWAVYKSKHMVKLFTGMAQAKVHFAIIIPFNWQGIFSKISEVSPGKSFMFLGTGDLALPAMLVVSALKVSLQTSLFTLAGALAGFILLYLIFTSQTERQPMPGLPPIVCGTLFGYFLSFLL